MHKIKYTFQAITCWNMSGKVVANISRWLPSSLQNITWGFEELALKILHMQSALCSFHWEPAIDRQGLKQGENIQKPSLQVTLWSKSSSPSEMQFLGKIE